MKISIVKAFDLIAEDWNEKHPIPRQWVSLFKPFLGKNQVVLDAGCGNGVNAIAVSLRVKKVYAIDASEKMVFYARKNVTNAGLEKKVFVSKASLLELPFKKSFFDIVVCFAVFHHFSKPSEWKKILGEFKRVLKPNGVLLLTVWSKKGKKKKTFVDFVKKTGVRIPRLHYFFEEDELIKILGENGFEAKKVFFEKNGVRIEKEKGMNLCVVSRRA